MQYKTSNQEYGNGVVTRMRESKVLQQNAPEMFFPSKLGIENIGNTCYINSMLQSIFNTQSLNQSLLSLKDSEINKSSDLFKSFYVLWFKLTQAKTQVDTNDVAKFKQNLCNHHKQFDNTNQQDCIEFFHVLLDLSNNGKNPFNFLQQQFQGTMTHSFICNICGNSSPINENFINLSLYNIQNQQQITITQLLNEYFKPEILNTQQQCTKCRKTSSLTKKSIISQAPKLLLIQLKRYDQNQNKLNTLIKIEKQLQLKPFSNKNIQYQLYAIINHQGYSIHHGHYTCLIKYNEQIWLNYNDQRVSDYPIKTVEEELSRSMHSYILFYCQV